MENRATATPPSLGRMSDTADSSDRARTRMCVGCGQRVALPDGQNELIRFILGPQGQLAVDARGGGFGRGAHVHLRRGCLERAVSKGFARAAKGRVSTEVWSDPALLFDDAEGVELTTDGREPLSVPALGRAIQAAMNRRIVGLLSAARRGRHLARGADAVTGAWQRGEARLVVVARDAAASATLSCVRQAISEGRALAWSTRGDLAAILEPRSSGALVSPLAPAEDAVATSASAVAGVAIIAITSDAIALALRDAVQMEMAAAAVAAGTDAPGGGSEPSKNSRRSSCAPSRVERLEDESPGVLPKEPPLARPAVRGEVAAHPGNRRRSNSVPSPQGPQGKARAPRGRGGRASATARGPTKNHRSGA